MKIIHAVKCLFKRHTLRLTDTEELLEFGVLDTECAYCKKAIHVEMDIDGETYFISEW